jgi:putative transposase
VLLEVSGLTRSTFFYQAPDPHAALKSAVTEIFKKNHGRYGLDMAVWFRTGVTA